jgi:hypothetical protein|eukprot:COSAG01_NODE_752_length_13837_cov_76.381670_24_plen_129_part_00
MTLRSRYIRDPDSTFSAVWDMVSVVFLLYVCLTVPVRACFPAVRRPFPSWSRPILTAIYLCHACSCQEILRRNGRGQGISGNRSHDIVGHFSWCAALAISQDAVTHTTVCFQTLAMPGIRIQPRRRRW